MVALLGIKSVWCHITNVACNYAIIHGIFDREQENIACDVYCPVTWDAMCFQLFGCEVMYHVSQYIARDAIYRNTLHAIWCITIHCMRFDVSQIHNTLHVMHWHVMRWHVMRWHVMRWHVMRCHEMRCIAIHCMWCIGMRCNVSQYITCDLIVSQYIACDALSWDAMYRNTLHVMRWHEMQCIVDAMYHNTLHVVVTSIHCINTALQT